MSNERLRALLVLTILTIAGCADGLFDKDQTNKPSQQAYTAPAQASAPRRPAQRAPANSRGTYVGVGMEHWIDAVISDGAYIRLEDGSLWEVAELDQIKSELWLEVQHVYVVESASSLTGYKLVNSDSRESVNATYKGRR